MYEYQMWHLVSVTVRSDGCSLLQEILDSILKLLSFLSYFYV